MTIRKVALAIVIAIGSVILLLVLLMVGFGVYGAYANDKADAAAKTFCNSIRAGANIEAVIRKAERSVEKNRYYKNEGEYRFTFPGAIFHASSCSVKTENGRVVSAELSVYDD